VFTSQVGRTDGDITWGPPKEGQPPMRRSGKETNGSAEKLIVSSHGEWVPMGARRRPRRGHPGAGGRWPLTPIGDLMGTDPGEIPHRPTDLSDPCSHFRNRYRIPNTPKRGAVFEGLVSPEATWGLGQCAGMGKGDEAEGGVGLRVDGPRQVPDPLEHLRWPEGAGTGLTLRHTSSLSNG